VGRYDFPLIIISKFPITQNELPHRFAEQSIIPFSILDLEKKIISLLARYKFKKSSLIHLCGYTLNKNEKKIEKNNLKLQLTEKEIDCLILFSQIDKPLSRSFILNNIWKYSPESDTHTVETHIYRLRKKILEKFDDNNFIKNNNKGYYI
jgi:DNA-binding response OmpR family regulator